MIKFYTSNIYIEQCMCECVATITIPNLFLFLLFRFLKNISFSFFYYWFYDNIWQSCVESKTKKKKKIIRKWLQYCADSLFHCYCYDCLHFAMEYGSFSYFSNFIVCLYFFRLVVVWWKIGSILICIKIFIHFFFSFFQNYLCYFVGCCYGFISIFLFYI